MSWWEIASFVDLVRSIYKEAGLEQTLREILARPALLEEYAAKGWACGAACHDIRRLHAMLRQDFEEVCDAGRSD